MRIDINHNGLYLLYFHYQSLNDSPNPIALAVAINGEVPFQEASQATLDTFWTEVKKEVGTDRYGNDVSVLQTLHETWETAPLKDAGNLYPQGLKFYFGEGENEIEISKISGKLRVSEIIIKPAPEILTYEEYIKQFEKKNISYLCRIEAEETEYKNSSSINRGTSRDAGVLPFSKTKLKLNVMGDDSYQDPGEAITWKADVPEAGLYFLTFKVKLTRQNTTHRPSTLTAKFHSEKRTSVFPTGWLAEHYFAGFGEEPFMVYLNRGRDYWRSTARYSLMSTEN